MTTYNFRPEIIAHEIIESLGDFAADFDIDAIADELIIADYSKNDPVFTINQDKDFWAVVESHAL